MMYSSYNIKNFPLKEFIEIPSIAQASCGYIEFAEKCSKMEGHLLPSIYFRYTNIAENYRIQLCIIVFCIFVCIIDTIKPRYNEPKKY